MKNNYFEEVKNAVAEWIDDNFDFEDYRGDRDGAEQFLYDELFCDDSVTGNGSGSYYCNSHESKEAVLHDMDTVKEALKEFCVDAETIGEKFLNEDWEFLDVTARCYVLGSAINEVLDEMEEVGKFDEE